MRARLFLQPLEERATPAKLINASTVTYQDADGDNVSVTLSKPVLTAANVNSVFIMATGTVAGDNSAPQQLKAINLNLFGTAGQGIGVTSVATRSPTNCGDGLVAIGTLNGTGVDLGAIVWDGDVGRVFAGDSTLTTTALASLKVHSLGRYGTLTGASNNTSTLQGKLGSLTVRTDIVSANVDVQGGADGNIGNVTLGGSLTTAGFGAQLFASGNIGNVKIGGSLSGGTNFESGRIVAGGSIGNVTIGGSLLGGSNTSTGVIEAGGNLGFVTIKQDLRTLAPNTAIITAGGTLAGVTIGGSLIGGVISSIGPMGLIRVTGDVRGIDFQGTGRIDAGATIAGLTIGGSLVGAASGSTANIEAAGNIGPIQIGGSMLGGSGASSSLIAVNTGSIASIKIGGSLIGGTAPDAGRIRANNIGPLTLGGSLIGGTALRAGDIQSNTGIASIAIGGNILGGTADFTGRINGNGPISTLTINGDIHGGSVAGNASLSEAGYIVADRIGTLTVKGSLIAGTDSTSGTFVNNGAIRTNHHITTATFGNIIGNPTNPAIISARGNANATATSDIAIGKLTVKGRMERTNILAGVLFNGSDANADAQIGSIDIGGDCVASNIIAGVAAVNGKFGDSDDAKMSGGVKDIAELQSKIGSITISGSASGSAVASDHFGIVAENLGVLKINGQLFATTAGANNDDLLLTIGNDFRASEV